MYDFTYEVTLRIFHPNADPNEICEKLGRQAIIKWKAGEKRIVGGHQVNIVNKNTFCCFNLPHEHNLELVDFLRQTNADLYIYKVFFNSIRQSGGKAEYFIGWFSDVNSGQVFDYTFLNELVDLGIELSLDIYGSSFNK